MEAVMRLEFCVLVLLAGSSQAKGQNVASPPVASLPASLHPAGASGVPDQMKGHMDDGQHQIHNPADDTTAEKIPFHQTLVAVTTRPTELTSQLLKTAQPGTQAAAPHNSPTTTTTATTAHPFSTFSSQDAKTSAWPPPMTSRRTTTTAGRPLTSHASRDPAGPQHPTQLDTGDEELRGLSLSSGAPLNPLLAGLLCVFAVATAVVFIVLFLRLRRRTDHPEFHRLQDLPMDDLMEDTPLSRYAY